MLYMHKHPYCLYGTLLLCAAVATPRAEAAGSSSSFKVDFDSIHTSTRQGDADSFSVIGGTSNIQSAGASTNFKVAPYALIASEESTDDSTATTEIASIENGGSRGGSASMAATIRTAYQTFLKKIGWLNGQPAQVEKKEIGEPGAPIVPERRNKLLATIDGRKVLYRDVSADAWYAPYVAAVIDAGIARGYESEDGRPIGEFGAENPVTKAEILKMTMLASGTVPGMIGGLVNRSARGTWAAGYVQKAEELQIRGYTRTEDVHAPANRAGILKTILELVALPIAKRAASYTDMPADHPDGNVIATATFYGLVSGFPDGSFRPASTMTRAAAAKVMAGLKNMLLAR